MQLKEPVRCIHIDPKSKKTTVKFLMPHVAERMRKYGWRVEHVAKPVEPVVEEAKEPISDDAGSPIGMDLLGNAPEPEIPTLEFIETPEPVIQESTIEEVEASKITYTAIQEPEKPKRKYATGKPTKVTNK